jgi:hypothetical protein
MENLSNKSADLREFNDIGADLLNPRTVEPVKQPLLDNGCITRNNRVTVGSDVFCVVRTEAIKRGPAEITRES